MIHLRSRKQIRRKFQEFPRKTDDSFHFAIQPVATFVQFLALMPVCGISNSNPSALHFKFLSFRVICTLLYISYGIFLAGFFFTFIYGLGISAQNIGKPSFDILQISTIKSCSFPVGFVFFSYTTICTIVFLFIARIWPNLMKVWAEKEKRFLINPYTTDGVKLSIKVRTTAGLVLMLATLEHVLFVANSAYDKYKVDVKCNRTIESPLGDFLDKQFPFLFGRIPFSLPLGIFVEIFNLSFTFGWNYMELFVMMVSIGLVTRFRQINKRLDGIRGLVRKNLVFKF